MLTETLEMKVPRKIDLTGLKAFARKELPLDSTLREMILDERDQIQAEEFIVKMEVWLKLFNREMKLKEAGFLAKGKVGSIMMIAQQAKTDQEKKIKEKTEQK